MRGCLFGSWHKMGEKKHRLKALAYSTVFFLATGIISAPAFSQNFDGLTARSNHNPDARMLLAADEVIYDRDNKTVTAQGHVQIGYDGHKLVAERVIYNQLTKRVVAHGNVEIIEASGNKIYADRIDITEDLGNGFIDTLRVESVDNTRFAADSAERQNGQMTIFNRGTYTACEPCYQKPGNKVLWQVKAQKIIWNGATKTMRFERSTFEMFGVQIGWLPVFEMPDPTVKRKSGLLQPDFSYNNKLGIGIKSSYFWNLAPNYDFTLSETAYTKQGFLTEGQWRHRVNNGSYDVRFAHIAQLDRESFDYKTIDRQKKNRYMVASTGSFRINNAWRYGWDILAQSDRNFSRTYGLSGLSHDVHRSQLYLTGLNGRNYFDMRFYHFEVQDSMLKNDPGERHSRQPWVLPRIEYSLTPDQSVFGGELTFNNNLQVIHRDRGDYSFSDWQNNPLQTARLAGISGTSGRWSSEAVWQRTLISDSGMVFTPLLALRGDLVGVDVDKDYGDYNPRSSVFKGIATAGLEVRYPILITSGNSTHIIEPTAQIFVRNNEQKVGRLPNEDAQSFVFDATTLFQRDKFSGYDRVEGGTRANLGIRYSGTFDNNWSLYALAGQSYQLGGRNSFLNKDFVNVGSESGLESARSDYVAMIGASNDAQFAVAARGRFDEKSGAVRRGELEISQNWGNVWASSQYAFIQAQPNYGYARDRQEISLQGGFKLTENWSINTTTSYDITSDTWVRVGAGVNYIDECFGLAVHYLQTRNPWENTPSNKVNFSLSFRTIGDFGK